MSQYEEEAEEEGYLYVPDEVLDASDPSMRREIFNNYEETAKNLEMLEQMAAQKPSDEDSGAGEGEEHEFDVSERAQELGVSPKWLVDAKTGEPYENGLIFGKWKTKEDAEDGIIADRAYLGKRLEDIDIDDFKRLKGIEDTDGRPAPEYGTQVQNYLDDSEIAKIDDWAMQAAREQLLGDPIFLKELERKGLQAPETDEDWTYIEDDSRLSRHLDRARDARFEEGKAFANEHLYVRNHLPEIEVNSFDTSYSAFRDEMIRMTGEQPNESDEAILMEMFNKNIEIIQEHKPQGTYTNRAGIDIPDPRGVVGFILLNEREAIANAVRENASTKALRGYEEAMDGRRKRTPEWPALPSQKGGGEDGSSHQSATLDELLSDGYIDKIQRNFLREGLAPQEASRRAKNEWDRQIAEAERRETTRSRQPSY